MTIEDQIRYQYYTPSPATYDPYDPRKPDPHEPKRLGKISESRIPSVLDYHAKNKQFVPGPGSYSDAGAFALPEGGRLNRNPPPERLKLDEYPKPGPGNYGVPADPGRPRANDQKFGKDPRVSKFIQDEVVRSRSIPGPGAHDVLESMEAAKPFCPEGGRLMQASKPPSYFDVAPTLSEGNPGPDRYNLPGAIVPHKASGKVVYRYESATLAETRDLITRTVGEANSAPGPGSYDLPDCPPIAGVPSLKGRSLPHAMPHPFAYNCQPDHGRNYGNLAPVRQSNNAAQIFGTGVKKGVIQRRKSSRPSSAGSGDEVQPQELPVGLGSIEEEFNDLVQWRSGGFTSMKKSRSSPAIREHPSVEEAAKFYPSLSKQHRKNRAFLPGAARRSESVATHDSSEEYGRLRRGKWHLKAMAESIENLTTAVFEPLDEERLKHEAMEGLRDKARERMLLEGVSEQQQKLVLTEMDSVLEEQVKKRFSSQKVLDVSRGDEGVAAPPLSVAA